MPEIIEGSIIIMSRAGSAVAMFNLGKYVILLLLRHFKSHIDYNSGVSINFDIYKYRTFYGIARKNSGMRCS